MNNASYVSFPKLLIIFAVQRYVAFNLKIAPLPLQSLLTLSELCLNNLTQGIQNEEKMRKAFRIITNERVTNWRKFKLKNFRL